MTYDFEPNKSIYDIDVHLPIITEEYFKKLSGLDINILLSNAPYQVSDRLRKLSIDAKVFLYALKIDDTKAMFTYKFAFDSKLRDAFLEYVSFYIEQDLTNDELDKDKLKDYIKGSELARYNFPTYDIIEMRNSDLEW
jgi:hypothetical protein